MDLLVQVVMIKPVEEKDIKKKAVKWSQRDQIRKDLKEAEENNVTVFELVDDIYNYKYLANAVREILKYDSGRRTGIRGRWQAK